MLEGGLSRESERAIAAQAPRHRPRRQACSAEYRDCVQEARKRWQSEGKPYGTSGSVRRPMRDPLLLLFCATASLLAPVASARKCPLYTDVANIANPALKGFKVANFLGRWFEIRSHNVPVLTTGCTCTRYNYTGDVHHWEEHLSCSKGAPGRSLTRILSKGEPIPGVAWPGEMQASVGPLPMAQYWVLDVELREGESVYEYAWLYACESVMGDLDEFIYFFSRTSTMPSTLENAWLARAKKLGIDTKDMVAINQSSLCTN